MEEAKLLELHESLCANREQRGSKGGLGRVKGTSCAAFQAKDDSLPNTELYRNFIRGPTMDIAVKNSRKTSRSGGSEDDAQPSKRRKQKDVVQLTTNSSSPLRFIDWLNENRECWTRDDDKAVTIVQGAGFVKSMEVVHLDRMLSAKVKNVKISRLSGGLIPEGWLICELEGVKGTSAVRMASIKFKREEEFSVSIVFC